MTNPKIIERHTRSDLHRDLHRLSGETWAAAHRRHHREDNVVHSPDYMGRRLNLGTLGASIRRGSSA